MLNPRELRIYPLVRRVANKQLQEADVKMLLGYLF